MDGPDRAGDDLTFKVNFTAEGVSKLRERVEEKLKEFMGDYTDDTLVEYVIVLLRNGRCKGEARKELDVFLGDDSVTFVSWLWDHLSSNLYLYVRPQEPFPDKVIRASSIPSQLLGRHNSQQECLTGSVQADREYEREKSIKVPRSRHNREWKGLVQEDTEVLPLRSIVTEILHSEEKTDCRTNLDRRSHSPEPHIHKKRSREDGRQQTKRESASHPMIGASSRLLQFAVRDAVRTVQQSGSKTEPALKRLRSVVSTATTDSVQDKKPQRTKSVARVPGALSSALKAAAEAAEDVIKVRPSRSVFDRLGHGIDTVEPVNQSADFTAPDMEDGEYEDFDQVSASNHVGYHERSDYNRKFAGNMTMAERETGIDDDSALDNDGYDEVGIVRHHGSDASQSASSAHKDKKSLMVACSVAQNADEVVRKTRVMDQDAPASSVAMTSSKIVNISVNVNTWKPPHYQMPRDVAEAENRMTVEKSEINAGKPNVRLPKENDATMAKNIKEMELADVQESRRTMSAPGSYTTGLPSDGVDSRTLFVSNVHFGATKDSLSRHFNKFGAVLKVIIVTDAATGQPTGSAYVEFLKKESAELALSLNGMSFMSRILKVVRSSARETGPMLGWPLVSRGSPFPSRFARIPYPRGAIAGAFRARLPVKPGARSLQWKREASTAQPTEGTKGPPNSSLSSRNSVLSPTARSLTYTRTEPKADANSGPA
ncbi:uncharacterized protein [Elaeis guineensis]|uniref:Uncharacterized protein LOC105038918 isoform X1 n=2 Tax=Elaeis guineensis var. tenera TaxID=51953 RepID=A0A6I9QPE5_ELAGV|nr:uncharacterized protein LOC105038918 isoform X1 [Elaeis guineensis]